MPRVRRVKSVPRLERLSIAKRAVICSLLSEGASIREIQAATGHHQETILRYRERLTLPNCTCGRVAGHSGWCSSRLKKKLIRQAYNQLMRKGGNAALRSKRPIQLAVESLIPAGLPPEIREEVVSQIVFDVISKKTMISKVNTRTYVRAAWPHDLSLLSLDAPIGETGTTLGEVLEG